MGDEGRTPFAASVMDPGLDADREGFDMSDAEDPMLFPLSDADEEARRSRLAAPPAPRAEVTGEERARLVAGCADAVLAWRGVYGAADLLVRELAGRLGVPIGEADALIAAEITGTQREGRRFSAGLLRTEKTYSN